MRERERERKKNTHQRGIPGGGRERADVANGYNAFFLLLYLILRCFRHQTERREEDARRNVAVELM